MERDSHQTGRERLRATVDALIAASESVVAAEALGDLRRAAGRLEAQRINLVVLGEFKRGKSTLVNALVDAEVVPTGVLPLTAVVVAIRYGERPRLIATLQDGTDLELAADRISDYATEDGNPGNRRGVDVLTLELPAALLANGLQLVDTPGIGSVHAHNTDTALGFLPQVDAALFTLAADQPLSAEEEALIRDASARIPKIFVVITKIDHLTEAESEQAAGFVRTRIRSALEIEPEIFAISARGGQGMDALRRRLATFATVERAAVLEQSVGALAREIAADALARVRFEARMLDIPVVELERGMSTFQERADRLGMAVDDTASLVRQAVAGVAGRTVDQPLLSMSAREAPALSAELERFASEAGALSARSLARRLDAWTDQAIRDRFEQLGGDLEQRITAELGQLDERYASRVERSLVELDEAAEAIFGVAAGLRAPEIHLRLESAFTFKLHDEQDVLTRLIGAASRSVPGGLGRRLVTRQARERLREMLDRHAGRLRSDLSERVAAGVRECEAELASVVSGAAASVRETVERAEREQRRGREHLAARLAELGTLEARVEQLQARLHARR